MQNKKADFVDDHSVRETFADTFLALQGSPGGVFHITLGTTRFLSQVPGKGPALAEGPQVFTSCRLVLSMGAVIDLANNLHQMLSTMQLDQAAQAPPGGQQQGH